MQYIKQRSSIIMIKISDFLGKPLISISDAKSVGYVSNVWFDGKLQYAKTAEITNDDDDYPERAYVELRYMQCDRAYIRFEPCVCNNALPHKPPKL